MRQWQSLRSSIERRAPLPLPVISFSGDLLAFVLPVVLSLAIFPFVRHLGKNDVPLFWKLSLETVVDVAHVYSTLYRTCFDSQAVALNLRLYLAGVPGLFAVALSANYFVGTWFGASLLAYYAMFHFAKQPFGIICLYKARCGERGAKSHSWDYWTCMSGALIPTLIWHAGGFDGFNWFGGEDGKLFDLPGLFRLPLQLAYALVPLAWLSRLLHLWGKGEAPFNVGKVWIMFAHYFTWFMTLSSSNQVIGMSFINLFHGFSSMALVRHVATRRYQKWREDQPESMRCTDRFGDATSGSLALYVALLSSLALLEDYCWDLFVYHDYLPDMDLDVVELTPVPRALATSLLMMPQLSHYFLDGFIWKMNATNPGLKEALITSRPQGGEAIATNAAAVPPGGESRHKQS